MLIPTLTSAGMLLGMVRLEQTRLEKEKVEGRMKMLEQYREEEKNKFMDKISRLTGRSAK